MKKIFPLLLCIPFIFNSCKKEESSSPPSTTCGSATVTVDGTTYTLTNPMVLPNGDCIAQSVVTTTNIAIGVAELGGWTINAMLNTPFSDILNGNQININQTYSTNNSVSGTTYIGYMHFNGELTNTNGGLLNGEITITNIDDINKTVDGNFSFTGYPVSGSMGTQQVSCVFSDIPFAE